ncbi:hypothetical protein OVA29_16130 [Exiguobacterium sp. SL14]|nr:hypothetical protein [Exiguobacterium sp. SL14]MCY1691968.1 hypothetical protein [Exiguobacterium sp. SL14]
MLNEKNNELPDEKADVGLHPDPDPAETSDPASNLQKHNTRILTQKNLSAIAKNREYLAIQKEVAEF